MSDPTLPDYNPFYDELTAYATSDDDADEPQGVVHLDGLPLPVRGTIDFVQLATFEPRFSIGDPTKDSDKFFSVWTQNDWTGGGQIEDINEGSDLNRFRHATAETRFPGLLTLPPETTNHTISGATGSATPVGDYAVLGTIYFWAAFGTELRYWDTATEAFIGGTTLAAAPANKGIVYDDLLFIPQGASGYDTWDGTTLTHNTALAAATNAAGIAPVSFVEWDDKLIALSSNGQVSVWDGVFWDSPAELRLRGDRVPRHLVVWWTPDRQPAVFVVTNRDVWVVDPLIPTLYRTGLQFPRHPDQGLGAAAWRDDAMYVSVGVGVHQLSLGGVVSAMGLDRGDGLPSDLRGAIVDLEPEYNGMLCLVRGLASVAVGDDTTVEAELESGMGYEAALVVPVASSQARSTLQRWTGTGWHTAWESPDATGTPTRVMVSEASDEYRIWWGYGSAMHSQLLRRTFHNPKQGAALGIDRFAPVGSLKTGRFDANMAMFRKLASHWEGHLDPASTQSIDILYQTDRTYPDWVTLGTITGAGHHVLVFDPDGDGWAEGEAFRWIEFDYQLRSSDALATPLVKWFSLKFIKLPLQTRSWRFSVPLVHTEQWTGRGPREIADQLDELAASERFVTFKHQDRTFRVRVAQIQGPELTGDDFRGDRVVSLIEIDPENSEAA